ncbi:hypothetical protein PAECIP111892_05035 [Paenibacillus auburnensis]|uniref:DUF3502 domain-containing protein n=1 Tax=Paenibacillus auburnensis TaxID=2905649 RepID=A0ABN8GXX5_9BACL|nr:DUF3502 domain-containing protein [Paenibacillus auburnensis]CAH1221746.1 hypothetical protein PAECIP111892_05035 [Paenibacillus auburnensis]
MKFKKPLFTLISSLLVTGVVMTGCSGNNNNASSGDNQTNNAQATANTNAGGEATADTSKPVKLTGYLLGSAPAGMDAVVKELNKKLKADINTEIDFRYIGWGDLASKYPLVLAAGEDVDFIFSANWAYYNQEAAKGAFREITIDEIQQYMPKHFAATNEVAWKEAQVNGKIFMIPTSSPDQKVPVTLIRGDLRKKYNIPEIKKFQDIEPYLEAVKNNERAIIPINADSQYDFGKSFFNLQWELGAATVDSVLITNGWSGTHTDWDDPNGKVYSQFDPYIMDTQKKAAGIVKSWYDKGYINKNAISNKVRSKDSFEQGKSAVAFGNTNDIQTTLAKAAQQGWEVEIIPNLSAKGTYPMDPYINNGVSIAAGSKNPERAMMALDLIMEEPSYNKLVYFGIEGVNYVEKDGKIDLPEGVTADSNTYAPDAAGFWFTNKSQFPPMANWTEQYIQHKESLKDILVPYVYNSLAMDTANIKTELANMSTVYTQYGLPIQGGIVKDVDKAFTELEKKAKDAGIDKIVAEAEKQTQEFLAKQK